MNPRTLAIRVRRLLAAGKLSRRRIAERLGITREMVTAVARGEKLRAGRKALADDPLAVVQRGPLRRCPLCGRLVRPPCQACRADGARKSNCTRTPPEREPPYERELRVDLKPTERAGYRKMRRRKTRKKP